MSLDKEYNPRCLAKGPSPLPDRCKLLIMLQLSAWAPAKAFEVAGSADPATELVRSPGRRCLQTEVWSGTCCSLESAPLGAPVVGGVCACARSQVIPPLAATSYLKKHVYKTLSATYATASKLQSTHNRSALQMRGCHITIARQRKMTKLSVKKWPCMLPYSIVSIVIDASKFAQSHQQRPQSGSRQSRPFHQRLRQP